MRIWILLAGMFLMGLLGAAYGALMLMSPSRLTDLIDRASFAHLWLSPVGARRRGTDIQMRIVGLVMMGGGIFFMYTALRTLLVAGPHLHAASPPMPTGGAGPHSWFDLAVPSVVTVFAIYLLVRPDAFLRWTARKMQPPREIKPVALRYLRAVVRVMAAIVLWGGVSGVYWWLRALV